MKNFDPINYNRQKWADKKNTKNHHPLPCQKEHQFCNFQYEWADETKNIKKQDPPINPSIPNILLPKSNQRIITVNYENTTQENIDDWIAQSLNRNLTSLINPKKKFFIPSQLEQDLKKRYRKKTNLIKGEESLYFDNQQNKQKKNSFNIKRKNIDPKELCFNYKFLQPKTDLDGTPIKFRQGRKQVQNSVRRRNAVLLQNDVHYTRLLRQISKLHEKREDEKVLLTQIDSGQKQMFYSFNIESMQRKSCYQKTPNSIIQKQFVRLRQPPKDFLNSHSKMLVQQQQLHEKYRMQINQKTSQTMNNIQSFSTDIRNQITKIQPKSETQISIAEKTKFKMTVRKKATTVSNSFVDTKSIGKDKVLEQKVSRLLNDMGIISQDINMQMAQLNIHLEVITLKNPDSRPQIKWALKAQQKIKQNQILLAMDCYKQALIIQPQFFIAVFNIAVLLQRQRMYQQAIKWFLVSRQFQTDQQSVTFGIALIYLKQMNFASCYQEIESLIQKNQISKKQVKLVYYYIRALCFRKLLRRQLTRKDYEIILKNSKPLNYNFLSNFFFSLIYSKSRRLSLKFDCLSYLNFLQTLNLVFFTSKKKIKDEHEDLKSLSKKIVNYPFFSRFSISLIQKMLSFAKYQIVKKDQLIFITEEESAVILNGLVMIKNHSQQLQKPETVALLKQGGIIGGGKLDNGMTQKSHNWFLATCEVQLIKLQRKDFYQIWNGQITYEFDFKYNFLKNVSLFKGLCDVTLFKICELIEKVSYQYGTILFNDCSYRNEIMNKPGIGFGLGKPNAKVDPRFVSAKRNFEERKKGKYRLFELIKKHIFKFNQMKFNRLKYPGIFILINGKIQIEDDRGFRCQHIICQRDYFGQNLVINTQGFHSYGRMTVISKTAQLYLLDIQKLQWLFTSYDKKIMQQNTYNRKSIQTLSFLRKRFNECQDTRINYKFLKQK